MCYCWLFSWKILVGSLKLGFGFGLQLYDMQHKEIERWLTDKVENVKARLFETKLKNNTWIFFLSL